MHQSRGAMKYNHKEVVRRAVKFDDQLLSDLADVADDVCAEAIKLVLQDANISQSDYEAYQGGKEGGSSTEVSQDYRRVRYEIDSIEKNFSAKMASGSSVSTGDLNQLKEALRLESEGVFSIKIEAGRFGKLRLEINFDAEYRGTEFTISGPRNVVNDVVVRLKNLFRNSEVDYSILRHKAIPYVLGPALCPVILMAVVFNIFPLIGSWNERYKFIAVIFLVTAIPLVVFSTAFAYSANFRPVEFDYGARGRRRRNRIAIIAWVFSAVFVPILLGLAKLG